MTGFRLGLIGYGGMGSRHAEGFDQLQDRVSVTVAVDIEPQRAQAVADHFPGCRAATDYREVLDHVDGVLIALPHRLHHPAARYFLDAGKHVLLEKPMATTEEHCLDLIEASERDNRVLMTAYVMRFNPLVSRMKELLDQRAYGDVFQVSIWTEQFTRLPGQDGTVGHAELGLEDNIVMLATAVADVLAEQDDPDHAVIGLRNHGITATGESLNEILDRIEPKILRQIPMY